MSKADAVRELDELARRWLKAMDLYLWANGLRSRQAAALAKADGVPAGAMRLGRLAKSACVWWKVEPAARVGRAGALAWKEWEALLAWLRGSESWRAQCGSLQGLCRYARWCGVKCSPAMMQEAMAHLRIAADFARPAFERDAVQAAAQVECGTPEWSKVE